MPKRIGVLIVHGIGSQEADFADEFIDEVGSLLGQRRGEIAWKPVWWAPILAERQTTLLRKLRADNDLDFARLRNFVVHALGDAIAYQPAPSSQNVRHDIYKEMHEKVAGAVHDLRAEIHNDLPPDFDEVPLVVVSHSLGCHVMSNHIWDIQHGAAQPAHDNPFERFESLAGIVTLGCNIPIFTLAYDAPEPIEFPARRLAQYLRSDVTEEQRTKAAKWINIYDPDDVLAYPLRPLSREYGDTVRADIPANIGGIATSWNPASHTHYFSDHDVTKRVSDLLSGLLDLLQ